MRNRLMDANRIHVKNFLMLQISASLKPGTTFLNAFSVTKINTSCTAPDIKGHS